MTVGELVSILATLPDDEVLWMFASEDGYGVKLVRSDCRTIVWEDA